MYAFIYPMISTMKPLRIFFSILILATIIGCAHDQGERKSAQVLFDEATLFASKGKVEKATQTFMEVRTYYPGDELARKALLATADLKFDEALYDEALESYKEYRLLYPTDTDAFYSLYKIGMCYFKQMNGFDRDQTQSVRAMNTFKDFINSYPNSPYVSDAREKLSSARLNIAKHYIYIGKFYLKKKNKEAACKRFQEVKRQYPDIGLDKELDELIAKACSNDRENNQISDPSLKEDQ